MPTAACAPAGACPYVLLIPGMLFTFVFFVVPLITLLKISLSTKPDRLLPNYEFTWEWDNFTTAFDDFGEQLLRSFAYAGIATVLCLLIAYPVAYFIAFKAGRYRNVLLGLVMVPFFTSFLLRTIAWQSLLNDSGPVLGVIERVAPRRPPRPASASLDDGRLLNTQVAVIGGLTYNFLPFMLLPIYVSLEKIDVRLVDAAADLYSPFGRTFRKVILPLSLPGVFAGTLLTFIPATGDFINAELLGNPNTSVIGNVVQTQFLERNDYPTAAAISFVLMAIITAARADLRQVPRHGGLWREPRPTRRRRPWGTYALYVVTALGFAYLFIPLITIAVFSFNDPGATASTPSGTPSRWTTGRTRSPPATTPTPSSCRCAWRSSPARSPPCSARSSPSPWPATASSAAPWLNLLLILPLTTPEIVFGASLFTLFFNQGVERGLLDDRHRPHDVLPVVRRPDRQGPASAASTGRWRTPPPTSARRRCGRSSRSRSR